MSPEFIILIVLISFILEFIDVSAGMGFGIMTPVLILMGFHPLEAIPAVLAMSMVFGLVGGFFHQKFKNVNFGRRTQAWKVTSALAFFGIIGVLIGVFVAVELPEMFLKTYIGVLIIIIGIILLFNFKKKGNERHLSWPRITFFGLISAFNKGVAGGGYGPVLTGGQMISGVRSKHAVGITTLTEGIISTVGTFTYMLIKGPSNFNWILIASLLVGGIMSIPFATYIVKKIHPIVLRRTISVISILLGVAVLVKVFVF